MTQINEPLEAEGGSAVLGKRFGIDVLWKYLPCYGMVGALCGVCMIMGGTVADEVTQAELPRLRS